MLLSAKLKSAKLLSAKLKSTKLLSATGYQGTPVCSGRSSVMLPMPLLPLLMVLIICVGTPRPLNAYASSFRSLCVIKLLLRH